MENINRGTINYYNGIKVHSGDKINKLNLVVLHIW